MAADRQREADRARQVAPTPLICSARQVADGIVNVLPCCVTGTTNLTEVVSNLRERGASVNKVHEAAAVCTSTSRRRLGFKHNPSPIFRPLLGRLGLPCRWQSNLDRERDHEPRSRKRRRASPLLWQAGAAVELRHLHICCEKPRIGKSRCRSAVPCVEQHFHGPECTTIVAKVYATFGANPFTFKY